MKASQFPLSTLKETPNDAEVISHQLMLRAGMIRKLASGLYTWLPLGLRVLRKVENIVRQEMNQAGALEVLMPAVQPAELWEESGRWDFYGAELLRLQDRHGRDFCFGPTHEEVITDLARNELRSYKQLPQCWYQIQTKFRDETRPRFGVMRAREFIMKDAYSFHLTAESLNETYARMHEAYCNIFSQIGLDFRPVRADTGAIGGAISHEFHVLAESGEDDIAFSDSSDYAANIELAPSLASTSPRKDAEKPMQTVATPNARSIKAVAKALSVEPAQCLKTLLVAGTNGQPVALLLRGDHELNDIKATKLAEVAEPLTLLTPEQAKQHSGCPVGSIGPLGLQMTIIADHAANELDHFVCGANEDGQHLTNVNWGRDLPEPDQVADLRNVQAGDPSPDGEGQLVIKRGIEVGHIFQLGEKYAAAMNASVLDESGSNSTLTMGCYGIGVSRVVASAIEQNYDEQGIRWPQAIAPFEAVIAPIGWSRSEAVQAAALELYESLRTAGVDVLLDDRDLRPGTMFADLELVGIPHRITIGDRSLAKGEVEYKRRDQAESENLAPSLVLDIILAGRS